MTKYIKWILPIVIILAAAVGYAQFKVPVEQVNLTPNPENISEETFNPISLLAMIEKDYDGHNLKVGQVLDNNSFYTRYYITYEGSGLTISGIMNVPKGEVPVGGFPVLILNHGFIEPSVYTNGRGLRREQDYLARQGYVVIHPDYRNHAQSSKDPDNDVKFRLGYVEDVINLIMAVKESDQSFLSKDKIGMLGHSMGGGVTLNLLVIRPDLVKAAVLFAPVSGDQRDNFERWLSRRPETAQKILSSFGSPEENPKFWDDISMINFLDRIKTPIVLHHGTADADVPIDWSDRIHEELQKESKEINYHVYPGQPHEFTSAWPEVMSKTTEFFNLHLK